MSPGEKTSSWVADLAAKLREDLAAAERQVEIASAERGSLPAGAPGRASMALASVCIDRAYTALEAGFLRIARLLDENVATGDQWHKALLHQMTLPIQDRRPAVLSIETVKILDVLLRHRHWLRHAYGADHDARLLWPCWDAIAPGVAAARKDVEVFLEFLASATPDAR